MEGKAISANQAVDVSLLILSDNEFVRQNAARSVRELIERKQKRLSQVFEPESVVEALRIVKEKTPQLLIVDLKFQSGNAQEAFKIVETAWNVSKDTKVILISEPSLETFMRKLHDIAPGDTPFAYILEEGITRELFSAMNSVLADRCYTDSEIAELKKDCSFSVLIADDVDYVRQSAKAALEKNFPILGKVYEANSVEQANSLVAQHRPDVLILDLQFQSRAPSEGLKVAELAWSIDPESKIIVASNHSGELYLRELRELAPDGAFYAYVLKDNLSRELAVAVRKVLSGDCYTDMEMTRLMYKLLKSDSQLSELEQLSLVCIALGLSDNTIAQLLHVCPQAVQARLRNLYRRLGLPSKDDRDAGVFNSRCRAVWIGLERGLINHLELKKWSADFAERARRADIPLLMQ